MLLCLLLVLLLIIGILVGFPVMFVLVASSIYVALLGWVLGSFDLGLLGAIPARTFGLFENQVFYAVPLFVVFGKLLEHSRAIEIAFSWMFSRDLSARSTVVSVVAVSVILAATTGLVGASILVLASIALPIFRRVGISDQIASGVICASGTLGQLIPPSIVLILLADQVSSAHVSVELAKGNFAPDPITIGHVFAGALVPGLLLAFFYALYAAYVVGRPPKGTVSASISKQDHNTDQTVSVSFAAIFTIISVLGVPASIITGIATPTEAAGIGLLLLGAVLIFLRTSFQSILAAFMESGKITGIIFGIVLGATIFALVFRGLGGDTIVEAFFNDVVQSSFWAVLLVLTVVFFLGFILEFVEITYLVVPISAPILFQMNVDPIWFAVLMALVLQTSFLTPPMGISLFYYRSVSNIAATDLFKSVVPFVILQLLMLAILLAIPELGTQLPALFLG